MSDPNNGQTTNSPSPQLEPEAPPPSEHHSPGSSPFSDQSDGKDKPAMAYTNADDSGSALSGETTKVWLAGAALLLAAAMSVGLLGTPTTPGDQNNRPKTETAQSTGSLLIQPIAASDTVNAISSLMMSEQEKAKVKIALDGGKLRLGWITVSDIQAEDGDWVRMSGAGFRQDIPLRHKPYTIAVTYVTGMPIRVTGLVDGSGGDITVAVYVGSSRVSLKPLKKGEILYIPSP